MSTLDVVDLGTKKGSAMEELISPSVADFLSPFYSTKKLSKKNFVGYERAEGEKYRKEVERKGFQFRVADLANDENIQNLPPAKVYLAWHFLEHLPSHDWTRKVVHASLSKASDLVWFRLPSFEQDNQLGEGALKKHGLRFTWTNWLGHPTALLVDECLSYITEWLALHPDRRFGQILHPADHIKSTTDNRVVPIDTPVDVNCYHPKYGAKPSVTFDPPLVAAWDIVLTFKSK